jgi:DNA-binding transcriptional MocR family regulator
VTFSKLSYLRLLHGIEMKPTTFRVLVTVFDYTNKFGRRAYPGNKRLAQDCCLSVKTVERALKELEKDGWVCRVARGGRSGDGAHWAAEYELVQPVELDTTTGQIDDVNQSDEWGQPVTDDYPSDHYSTDHYTRS